MNKRDFYRLWLVKTFIKPLLIVDLSAGLLTITLGAIVYFNPSWGDNVSVLLWAIPSGILVVSIVIGFFRAPYIIYRDSERKRQELQMLVDSQGQGKGLLERLDRLEDAWIEILNRQVDTDSDFERWEIDFARWKASVMLHIQDIPLMNPNIKRSGYNDKHILLQLEGDKLWKTMEVKVTQIQTEL